MNITRRLTVIGCSAVALSLSACAPSGGGTAAAHVAAPSVAERGYVSPPAVLSAGRRADGEVILVGTASPAARVRLASPAGAQVFAIADAGGDWRLVLPRSPEVRLFGLSMPGAGRPVQAEGYLVVAPDGLTAQLGAGSGAVTLGRAGPGPAILAVDFDGKGGAVLSGIAPAGAPVTVTVDGAARGGVNANAAGRFMAPLNEPLKPGDHLLAIAVGARGAQRSLSVTPAQRPSPPPFRAEAIAGGWRIDWLTPGGGVQTTVLFAPGTP